MITQDDYNKLLDQNSALARQLDETETRRLIAQGKADTYKLELQSLRKAREKGRRANRTMRQKLTELEARLYRLTNRGDVYDKVARQYGLSAEKSARIRSKAQA